MSSVSVVTQTVPASKFQHIACVCVRCHKTQTDGTLRCSQMERGQSRQNSMTLSCCCQKKVLPAATLKPDTRIRPVTQRHTLQACRANYYHCITTWSCMNHCQKAISCSGVVMQHKPRQCRAANARHRPSQSPHQRSAQVPYAVGCNTDHRQLTWFSEP